MTSEALPEHIDRPAIRRVHPIPLQKEMKDPQGNVQNVMLLGLQDPCQLSSNMMAVPPHAFQVMQLFNGERTIAEIVGILKAPDAKPVVDLVSKLDEFGLLWGPTSEALETKKREELATAGALPPGASRELGEDAAAIRQQLELWLDAAEDAEIEEPIAGIVVSHLDYMRGHPVYAASYRLVAKGPKPDRVVIVGTNHFGLGDGAIVADLALDCPLGRSPLDAEVQSRLREEFGEKLFKDVLDFVSEYSIQRQLPWIQHLFGDVPVTAILLPDPNAPLLADDGARASGAELVAALSRILGDLGGRTLVVGSADMSHAGPQFGEPKPVAPERRREVEAHDREMLKAFLADPASLAARMLETRNPTRWTSIGAFVGAGLLAKPSSAELIDYRQTVDEQGHALVSSASIALLA
ncbi:MAG: hypothetical protein RIS86_1053 [Planctomycetota bacterium]